jgi:hypothetical protein
MLDLRRRDFVTLLGGAGLLCAGKARRAWAQQAAMPVIGIARHHRVPAGRASSGAHGSRLYQGRERRD